MAKLNKQKLRPLEIEVSSEHLAYWKCAAALDPVPPTWAGPTWAELLSAPVDADGSFITVLFPTSFLARFRSRDERQTLHMLVPAIITDHALHILGACLSSRLLRQRESDSFLRHEQAFSPLED